MNNRRNKKVVKNFKDYIIPIVWVLIILILILNFIFGWDDTENNTNIVNNTPIEVSLKDNDTEAYVVYASWDRKKVEGSLQTYKWEKLQVWTKWSINISLWNEEWNISLNRLWELKYNESWTFTLLSSDLWVNTKKDLSTEMRYIKVSSKWESVYNLSQNEVASSVYVLYWNIEIQNTAWNKTTLQKWQKITIMRNEANDKDLDLSLKKEAIDDYIKNDDWYLSNNWSFFLDKVETSSWSTKNTQVSMSWAIVSNNSETWFNYVSFNYPDESDINTDTINIEWSLLDDIVYKVEINWQTADINTTDKTFSLKNLKVTSRVNNIVYRVFDSSNKLLDKWVLTLYYSKWWTSTTNATNNSEKSTLASVENYSLTNSPLYQIISPKENPYTTSESVIMIEWTVPARTVSKIIINWFQLQQFPANWTYWKYFANEWFWNLKDWLNIYKIEYYGADWKIIFENNYTIIKEPKKEVTPVTPIENSTSNTSTWENAPTETTNTWTENNQA